MRLARISRLTSLGVLPLLLCVVLLPPVSAQTVGDQVRLVERELGIPGHPAPGNPGVSQRFAGGTTVTVQAIDTPSGWFQVQDPDGAAAWITRTYIAQVVTPSPVPAGQCYPVGTWNLEWFHAGKSRGFPENTRGGSSYPARTPNDLTAIAAAIRDTVGIRILILNEINGETREIEGESQPRSAELDALAQELGPAFQYLISRSGGSQRVALLWDTRVVRLNAAAEIPIPRTVVQGKDLFSRDPLLAHFTFLSNGQPQNDLLVVGIHLAAGQQLTQNHDAAMSLLIRKLTEARTEGTVLPAKEFDILIGGDLNADWFDDKPEHFFDDLNTGDWAVLASPTYSATRLADVPLSPKSHLDYLIVTRKTPTQSGLLGEEIHAAEASVHQELANGDWNTYRQVFSDHFPVTTCVGLMADND